MKFKRRGDSREIEIDLVADESTDGRERLLCVRIDQREVTVVATMMPDGSAILALGGKQVRVAGMRHGASIMTAAGPFTAEFVAVEGHAGRRAGGLVAPEVDAPMPGRVLKVLVSQGQPVEQGDGLVVLEAMKMETTLYAESPAIIKKICIEPGQMVDHGARLIELSPAAVSAKPAESPPQDE